MWHASNMIYIFWPVVGDKKLVCMFRNVKEHPTNPHAETWSDSSILKNAPVTRTFQNTLESSAFGSTNAAGGTLTGKKLNIDWKTEKLIDNLVLKKFASKFPDLEMKIKQNKNQANFQKPRRSQLKEKGK
ncbi:hypothetical protein HELRODRAFT_176138 [Helobdella robusta]|uniref:Uncharacterized protein n=1 Tax=Helobdella robusta TaxID=6412 RepID=T1FA69_HELRO|nr:hypothetical protein HELRODRAFT_176138 [Helobdella robusta]ESO00274.1 hypothetical protein HELRODRAFT_176138 [Helobdella robusta]